MTNDIINIVSEQVKIVFSYKSLYHSTDYKIWYIYTVTDKCKSFLPLSLLLVNLYFPVTQNTTLGLNSKTNK